MNTLNASSTCEPENGKYVIIKVPRESIRTGTWPPILSFTVTDKFRTALWVFLCIVSLLIGIIIGSVFHDSFLHANAKTAVWKSFSLQNPDGR
jgi:hypothetical protein